MKPNSARLFFAFVLFCTACAAAEPATKSDKDADAQKKAKESTVPSATKTTTQSTDKKKTPLPTTPSDVPPAAPAPAAPAKAEKEAPKDPAAEAEKARLESEAALARGEGERYARRQKAYEAARANSARTSVDSPKRTSIAQMELADGTCVVIVGNDRTVFPNKAAADAYVADIKRAENDRPINIGK